LLREVHARGEENLNKIVDEKVISFLKDNPAKDVEVLLDASFVKAWSTRGPIDVKTGYSCREAAQNIGKKDKAASPTYFNT
jgi:hypothetical protein